MQTLESPATHEMIVKKSRFIARASRADSPESASAFLARVRESDANHNCWAYKIASQYRFSDDGEPGGTAGRPILAAIEGQGLDLVVVVVTRYFGGIKLGAGGLVRAYGGTAAECLRLAQRVEVKKRKRFALRTPFDGLGQVYPLLERFDAIKLDEAFDSQGLTLQIDIAEDCSDDFDRALRDATRGTARLAPVE
jgi:uncharacterized YigZ family protein